jgi:hypothetical protein
MNWRIEQATPFALLRELPDGLFQTCIMRNPANLPGPSAPAVLRELLRVTREDGTLWLLGAAHEGAAIEAGWHQLCRRPARPRLHGDEASGCLTVALLSKQPEAHLNARLPLLGAPRRTCASARGGSRVWHRRRAWCVPSAGRHDPLQKLIDWCIQASTSPLACQVCGAPWRRCAPARVWRPGCAHGNGRGRCLVLDPFCGAGVTGVLALLSGRSFLGIEPDPRLAHDARRRLAIASWAELR